MSRLFITNREQQFISHINKEFVKDVVGQYIIYFPVSSLLTRIHPVYDEAVEKIFENPIKLNVLASPVERENKWDVFGTEKDATIEVLVHPKDMTDMGIQLSSGDYFVYGDEVFEVIGLISVDSIFGQAEYDRSYKLKGHLARIENFDIDSFKHLLQMSDQFSEAALEKRFVQKRGLSETEEGFTNDRRELRERLGEDMAPIALNEGPRKVDIEKKDPGTQEASDSATNPKSNVFYDE